MRFYGKAARLQAPSPSIGRAIASEAPQLGHKVTAIPYPATRSIRQRTDPPERTITASPAAIGDQGKIILFVGRVHPEKGVHLLLEAFVNGARSGFRGLEFRNGGPAGTRLGGGG